MKILNVILFFLLVIILVLCSKDDINEGVINFFSFNLLFVFNNVINVSFIFIFIWEESIGLNGEIVIYDLYI